MIKNIKKITKANMLNKLIYLNIGVFLFIITLNLLSKFQINITSITEKLYLSANKDIIISNPWTFVSYMFIHNEIYHLFWNMLLLYFGGKIFTQYLNSKQLLTTYILGGISGAILFIIFYNYLPSLQSSEGFHRPLIGSSASVIAILIAISTYKSNYNIHFPLLSINIKLKHIVIFLFILDLIRFIEGTNTGGHIAHLGGAIFGYLYIKQLHRKNDIFTRLKKNIKKRSETDYDFNKRKTLKQKEIDLILDKISKSGYESLSKAEKTLLFSESKK